MRSSLVVCSSIVVALVILGGIGRIGKVTSILAPAMAAIYVAGAMVIIILNIGDVIPAFGLIFREAFNPTSGVAGTGVGAFLVTLMWGVRRGLFSNEAGLGSAPNVAAVATVPHPVHQGIVQSFSVFIDTALICTATALIIMLSGVTRIPSFFRKAMTASINSASPRIFEYCMMRSMSRSKRCRVAI